jgi:hypothetical protein
MTKTIRVENADNSPYKVIVEVWDKPYTDREGNEVPAKLARTINLDNPCAMTPADLYLTSTRYLVVKEAE